jgi:peptidoglycan DL-endopeptidase CwlO
LLHNRNAYSEKPMVWWFRNRNQRHSAQSSSDLISLTVIDCISAQECLETMRIRRLRLPLRHSTSAFRLIFVIATVGVALVAALPVSASPKSDVASKRAQAVAARAQLAELGAQLEPAIERYNKAVAELKKVDADIAFNQKQILVTESNLKVSQTELSSRLQQSYRVGEPDLIASILGQQSLSEILAVSELFDRSQNQAAGLIDGLETDKQTLKRQRQALQAAEDRAATLKEQRAQEKQAINAGIAQSKSLAFGLEGEIAALIQEEAARQERLRQAAMAALAAQQAATNAAGNQQVDIGGSIAASSGGAPIELPPTDGSVGAQAVAVAMQYLGTPYVWGGGAPGGFDCSGLTSYAYAQVGVGLSHFTGAQWNEGVHVPADQLLPGDLVFFHSDLHHMGMYIGGGQMIHAPQTGDVVKISGLMSDYAGAVRPY